MHAPRYLNQCPFSASIVMGIVLFILLLSCSSLFLLEISRGSIGGILLQNAPEDIWTRNNAKQPRFGMIQYIGATGPLRMFGNHVLSTRSKWNATLTQLDKNCPIILSGDHQVAGLGHAFMSFNTLVALASFYDVTLNATFPKRLTHGQYQRQVSGFFHGDVFHARFREDICKTRVEVDLKEIDGAIGSAKQACRDGLACVKISDSPEQVEALVDVEGYRSFFTIPESIRRQIEGMPWIADDSVLRIIIHIRRGDIVGRPRRTSRWVYNKAYIDFIPRLVERIQTSLPIAVIILAEGAVSIDAVPDVTAGVTSNFSILHDRIILGPNETHLALATMCLSDVLITSSSSFSHVAALMCERPHVLVLPFWYSYVSIPNTLSELLIERDEQEAIVSLELPPTFKYRHTR